jgi:hypothetical protein
MQERPPSTALVTHDWEATATRSTTGVRACKSEDLPAVPGAPRPAAHRPVEWAFGRTRCGCVPEVRTANRIGYASAGGDQHVD